MFSCEIVFLLVKGACFRTSTRDISRTILASLTLGLEDDDWGHRFRELEGIILLEDVIAPLQHKLTSEGRRALGYIPPSLRKAEMLRCNRTLWVERCGCENELNVGAERVVRGDCEGSLRCPRMMDKAR